MVNEGVHFSSEVRRWLNLWNNKSYQKKQNMDTTQTLVDDKSPYIVESPPDSFVDVLKAVNVDFFQNIKKLLLIGATFPIIFLEEERAASGIRKLKTTFPITMRDHRKSNLNRLQIDTTGRISVEQILEMFIKKPQEDCFYHL